MSLIVLLPWAVAAVATTLWSVLWVSLPIAIVIGLAWLLAGLVVGKFALVKVPIQISVMAGLIVVSSIINITFSQQKAEQPKDDNSVTAEAPAEESEADTNPEGTIVVEAGDGTLTKDQYDYGSYIAESARGREAYLASKLATASYNVEVATPGKYNLWVKLSDDAVHPDSSRDATVTVNSAVALEYRHLSEDTKGWKYFDLGLTELKAGSNKFEFTKVATTSAAFVMDEFKLIPAN